MNFFSLLLMDVNAWRKLMLVTLEIFFLRRYMFINAFFRALCLGHLEVVLETESLWEPL